LTIQPISAVWLGFKGFADEHVRLDSSARRLSRSRSTRPSRAALRQGVPYPHIADRQCGACKSCLDSGEVELPYSEFA
jgi:hypothetical protein